MGLVGVLGGPMGSCRLCISQSGSGNLGEKEKVKESAKEKLKEEVLVTLARLGDSRRYLSQIHSYLFIYM